ncbi:MAG: hypothetical protein AB1540_12120 [Bdellovibrionota bacterium]
MKKITLFLLICATQAIHAEETPGPHGGHIVRSEAHQFEVKIDPDAKNIEVYTLNKQRPAPKTMTITLFRESGTGQTIVLEAVNLKDPLPRYQGELSLASGPYVGAELRFEISVKSFKILKFMPYIPNRGGRF